MDPQTLIEDLMEFIRRETQSLVFPKVEVKSCPVCSFYGQESEAEKFRIHPSRRIGRMEWATLLANFLADRSVDHDITVDEEGIGVLMSKDRSLLYLSVDKAEKPRDWEFYIFPWPL